MSVSEQCHIEPQTLTLSTEGADILMLDKNIGIQTVLDTVEIKSLFVLGDINRCQLAQFDILYRNESTPQNGTEYFDRFRFEDRFNFSI
jgi:hypothetical protein